MTVLGRVGKDPETRTLNSGSKVTKFTVAVTEKYKNKAGDWVENTTWVTAEAWDSLGDIFAKYTKKGDEILLIGTPKAEAWIDSEGKAKAGLVLKIKDFDFVGGSGKQVVESAAPVAATPAPAKAPSAEAIYANQDDDNLPF